MLYRPPPRMFSLRQKQNFRNLTVISVISSVIARIVEPYVYKNASTIFIKQVVSLVLKKRSLKKMQRDYHECTALNKEEWLSLSFVIKGRHVSPDNLCLSFSLSSSVSSPEKPQSFFPPPPCNGSAGAGPLPGCSYRKSASGARGQSRGGGVGWGWEGCIS